MMHVLIELIIIKIVLRNMFLKLLFKSNKITFAIYMYSFFILLFLKESFQQLRAILYELFEFC